MLIDNKGKEKLEQYQKARDVEDKTVTTLLNAMQSGLATMETTMNISFELQQLIKKKPGQTRSVVVLEPQEQLPADW